MQAVLASRKAHMLTKSVKKENAKTCADTLERALVRLERINDQRMRKGMSRLSYGVAVQKGLL